jgi:hypothetical protein
MYKFDISNIDLIEGLLFDADFLVRDIPERIENGKTTFDLRRPYWESPIRTKFLWIKRTRVKEIFTQVIFDGIKEIKVNWIDDIFNEPHRQHSIYAIEYKPKENILWCDMAYFELNFVLEPNFEIKLRDHAGPTKKNFLNIFGSDGMDFDEWKKDYENCKKTHHNNT